VAADPSPRRYSGRVGNFEVKWKGWIRILNCVISSRLRCGK
jgi:hypothetical protein